MQIIGFSGRLGAGKTTAAKILQEHIDEPTEILSFSTALKDLARYLGWNGEKNAKGRRLLQLLGTDICRDCIDEDYWVEEIRENIEESNFDSFIIDDVRFDNEAKFIKSNGGYIISIKPKHFLAANHKSEVGIAFNLIDKVVNNNGSLEDLKKEVITAYENL